jgi:hypothetical protein
MNYLKSFPFLFVLLVGLLSFQSTKGQATISLRDFKVLHNTSWEGTLTYLDYQSGELTPIATTMQMRITDKAIETDIQYTWEPNKNVQAITKIKKKGSYLGKQKVISKTQKEDGTMQLITSAEGKDDLRKATLFYTYEFGIDGYKVTKEVQLVGSNERFVRNTYDYKKIKS